MYFGGLDSELYGPIGVVLVLSTLRNYLLDVDDRFLVTELIYLSCARFDSSSVHANYLLTGFTIFG